MPRWWHPRAIDVLAEKSNNGMAKENVWSIEGNVVLEMDDEQEDLARFLCALYDGCMYSSTVSKNRRLNSSQIVLEI